MFKVVKTYKCKKIFDLLNLIYNLKLIKKNCLFLIFILFKFKRRLSVYKFKSLSMYCTNIKLTNLNKQP